MTRTLLFGASFALLLATAATAQDRPAGAEASGCDLDRFTPVMTSHGEVAYWMNPTCVGVAGSEEPEFRRSRDIDLEVVSFDAYLQ